MVGLSVAVVATVATAAGVVVEAGITLVLLLWAMTGTDRTTSFGVVVVLSMWLLCVAVLTVDGGLFLVLFVLVGFCKVADLLGVMRVLVVAEELEDERFEDERTVRPREDDTVA